MRYRHDREDRCQICRFYDQGYCLRHAPVSALTSSGMFTSWPQVNTNQWCGDFESNPAAGQPRNTGDQV